MLLKDLNDYLRGGILRLGGIALAVMMLILLVLFDVRWRPLPLAVIVVGVIWAFGLAGYIGIPLSIVTIAGLPVMIGVGIDYAIQMHARVEEEVLIDRSEHPIQETARNLGPALLVVTFDAVFAFFSALMFAKVPTSGTSACCSPWVSRRSACARSSCRWPPWGPGSTAPPPRATTSERALLGRFVRWLGLAHPEAGGAVRHHVAGGVRGRHGGGG